MANLAECSEKGRAFSRHSIFSISHFLQMFYKQSLTNQVLPIGLIQFILPTTDLLCRRTRHPTPLHRTSNSLLPGEDLKSNSRDMPGGGILKFRIDRYIIDENCTMLLVKYIRAANYCRTSDNVRLNLANVRAKVILIGHWSDHKKKLSHYTILQ